MPPSRLGICGALRMVRKNDNLTGMSQEDRLIRGIDNKRAHRFELTPVMLKAHEKAQKEVLNNKDYVIQERDFIPVYGEENVRRDLAETDRLATLFAKEQTVQDRNTKVIAEVLEAIVLMNAEMNEWLGEATTLKAARFDDFKNKTDMVAEWFSPEDGSRVLALAVDITFGSVSVTKKMESIKAEIDSGNLGTIRYFKDERGDFMGTRNNVPRVVIGVSSEMVEELAALWLKNDNKALATHAIQRLLVEEITLQLECMHAYAQKRGRTYAENAYMQALAVIQPLMEQKSELKPEDIPRDPVVESIRDNARRIFN